MIRQVEIIFQDVFDNKNLSITTDTTFDEIEDWDSVAFIDVLTAIENEFSIKFNLDEAQNIKNVSDIVILLNKKKNGE